MNYLNGFEPVPEIYTHLQVCRDSMISDTVYRNFKNNPAYTAILEHCPYDIAKRAYEKIRLRSDFPQLPWEFIRKNDMIGNPELREFDGQLYSPTTILYVYQALDIIDKYTYINKIVEIGAGYGGLCYILHILYRHYGMALNMYTIIDLPDVIAHQKKYLNDICDVDITFVNAFDTYVFDGTGLCISIFAMGEFCPYIVNDYIERVISKCEHFYFWWNITEVHPYFIHTAHIQHTGISTNGHDLLVFK